MASSWRLALATVISVSVVVPVAAVGATQWVPCPVLTYRSAVWNGTLASARLSADLETSFSSECTFARVPLDHQAPQGASRQIEVFVKRLSPKRPKRQLLGASSPGHAVWLLSGGPGDSSADDVEPLHALLAERLQPQGDYEIFILDHRGTARSSRLGCRWSQAESAGSINGVNIARSEWPGCLESLSQDYPGSDLHHFSSSGAARDLHMLMERFRRPGQSINVFGISYGTYWGGHYARLFPGHARSIILDGVVSYSGTVDPPQRLTYERWDQKLNAVGKAVLDQKCAGDDFCRSKLGPKPSERLKALFDALATGEHCAGSVRSLGGLPALKEILGSLLYSWSGRQVVTAILYRLLRCSPGDEAALAHLAASRAKAAEASLFSCCSYLPPDAQAPPQNSKPLLFNVALSELWDPAVTLADMDAWAEQSWFTQSTFFRGMAEVRPSWPVHTPDSLWNTSLKTSTPVLLMNGDVDGQTPLWSAEREYSTMHSSGGVTLLVWPDAVHYSTLNTPVTDGGDPCGLTTVVAFFTDPERKEAWRNPPCRGNLQKINFHGDEALNRALWGTADAYDGMPQPLI